MLKNNFHFDEIWHSRVLLCEKTENDVLIFLNFRFEVSREIHMATFDYEDATKTNVSLYQSIGNDKTMMKLCLLFKFVSRTKIDAGNIKPILLTF